ncbi:MAG: carbohydrate binding domain-containing protein, partial [Agathobacter sp.]
MELQIRKEKGVEIRQDMIGLFFEDINYAADGGLYAEMLENRGFEFVEAYGDAKDYYVKYDGEYGWWAYPNAKAVQMQAVMGSPHTESNPHYMRIVTKEAGAGIGNQAYEGIYLEKGMNYHVYFWARPVKMEGAFVLKVEKEGKVYARAKIEAKEGTEETYNFYKRYDVTLTAEDNVEKAQFIFALEQPGIAELDFISVMPESAV